MEVAARRVKVRASSWAGLFDCPSRWEGVHLLGMKSVSGLRATLGTAVHASTAIFDQGRMNGDGITATEAAAAFIDRLHHPEGEVDYRGEDLTIQQAERIGLTLHSMYCNDISPRYDFVAVEMDTEPLVIDCGDGLEIEVTGTMDRARVVRGEYGVGIGDIKTGKMAVTKDHKGRPVAKTAGHAAQIGTYELLYENTTGESITAPAEIIALSTGARQEVAVGQIEDARDVLLGTEETPGLIQYAAQMFKSGLFHPNNKSQLCSAKYCPRHSRCAFRDK